MPGGIVQGNKEGGNVRESKGKAKQYTTINARTVVIKDTFVYSNKGFKSLNQAQLLSDTIFYSDGPEKQQWLVYYISRPLVGSFDAISIIPATIKTREQREAERAKKAQVTNGEASQGPLSNPKKKEIATFNDLLNEFPMIARQMHVGLENILKDYSAQFDKPLSRPPLSRSSSVSSHQSSKSLEDSLVSLKSAVSDGETLRPTMSSLDPEEDSMRFALENATTAAIDLFQGVDKQQLSLLGATTNLSGPAVERLIEKYIAEQLHERSLFPRLCSIRRSEDLELESRIRRMTDIDIAQVGIPIEHGKEGKRDLALRMDRGVAVFKKLGVAGSPQEMIEILLGTQKAITEDGSEKSKGANGNVQSEKRALTMTMNADLLVSMLLIVVIRSTVRHLNARLSYMRNFVFIDDVESGETGYALSTFEAVLMYLSNDSDALKSASRRNGALWHAVKEGDMAKLRSELEPGRTWPRQQFIEEEPRSLDDQDDDRTLADEGETDQSATPDVPAGSSSNTAELANGNFAAVGGSLTHVFPFQKPPTPPPEAGPPKRKRVVLASTRSASVSSGYSSRSHSRTKSVDSGTNRALNAETSVEKLTQTQDVNGDSLLMMAVDNGQEAVFKYLLGLDEFFTVDFVLEDCNNEGTTLLSTALQGDHFGITQTILKYVLSNSHSNKAIRSYLARQDGKGRSVAHYLFNQPRLIEEIGNLLPWQLKDKNGQTPLFALCRSYDHPEYHQMVSKAIAFATTSQGDGEPLHLDDHVDSKGNTLLHVVIDPALIARLLSQCDADVNAPNAKRFTPLMVASKYGKIDLVRILFGDPRVELLAKDLRGLTAIELAKDDEVRNRIDDMVLLSVPPEADGRITTVVRSFFVEDASIRLVLKSGGPNPDGTMTVTTCRRSLTDFENLAKWLALEQPASWLPSHFANLPSPFLIPSKPSRAALRDIQLRLDSFLHNLLTHASFSTHELVWEFFLVPDIDPAMLAERSKHKAEVRVENVRDEYIPIEDTTEVEVFVQHAQDQVRKLALSTKLLLRRITQQRLVLSDMSELQAFASTALSTLTFLPQGHKTAFDRYSKTSIPSESSPIVSLHYAMHSITATTTAILMALNRPAHLIGSMEQAQRSIDRQLGSLSRQSRWTPNIGIFDDTRRALEKEATEKAGKASRELEGLGSELRYTQQTVAAELAGWQEEHVRAGRNMLKAFARGMVVQERARLESMKRALRELRK